MYNALICLPYFIFTIIIEDEAEDILLYLHEKTNAYFFIIFGISVALAMFS